jgi:ribosome-binding factor A
MEKLKKNNHRIPRMNQALLTALLTKLYQDTHYRGITWSIVEVSITQDLSFADVWVCASSEHLQQLQQRANDLRHHLTSTLGWRRTPRLRFKPL